MGKIQFPNLRALPAGPRWLAYGVLLLCAILVGGVITAYGGMLLVVLMWAVCMGGLCLLLHFTWQTVFPGQRVAQDKTFLRSWLAGSAVGVAVIAALVCYRQTVYSDDAINYFAKQTLLFGSFGQSGFYGIHVLLESLLTVAVEQITFANVTVTGIVAEGSVGAENTIIQDGTFQKDVYADDNSTIAGGTFQDVVRAYGTITGGAFNAVVQLNQNSEVTGGVFHDIQLPSYATEKTVIQNAMILGSLKTDGDSKAAVSNTVSCGYIESKYLAAGQQQSKLMMTDGTVERLNDYAAATDAVYLIGNVKAEIRFSNTVTNINGAEASNYNEGTSAIDRSLTITAKNDGEPIVVNMAATGKLPFSSLSKSDFDIDWSTLVPGITCKKDGVGKLSLVYVRTYDDRVFETYPAGADMYGLYKQRIVAQEGDKYTEGSLDIGEVVRRYQANRADFAYDSKTQTANYTGPMYFDDAPHYSIQYVPEDGSSPSVTKPTKAGTYSVYIVVDSSDHYDGAQYEVGTYTVSESKYTLTVDDKSTEHVAGEKLSFTADEKDGYTFTGWKVTGLPNDVDTTKATISFTMPANNVTLKAQYTENAPKTYKLDVSGAQVTLKDGSDVADLTAVSVGTELKATADEDTETSVFKNWSCTGLELTEEQSTARVVYFTMPDHDVNLKAEFVTPTNKLDVSGAQVTLKDGGAVADLTAVPVGTELKATADEDTETSVFKNWNCTGLELTEEQRTAHEIYFTMPDHDVNLKAVFEVPATPDPDPTPDPKPDPTPDPDPTPAPGGDSDGGGAAIVAVAAVGGAAIGVGAYIAGTTAYLKSVLPEGMAIPANRQQLAVALWTAAGKPATQSTALFNDVAADAAELQAIRWVVETGLMSAQDGSFKPGSRVGRMEVIRTWKTYQQRG